MTDFVIGRDTVIIINGTDISIYCNNTEEADETEQYDVTCYGPSRKRYKSGLGDGKITVSGNHHNGANNPRDTIKPIKKQQTEGTLGTVVLVYRPEGTGSGKAQTSVPVNVANYVETDPVAGVITWKCEFQMSGDLDETDQT